MGIPLPLCQVLVDICKDIEVRRFKQRELITRVGALHYPFVALSLPTSCCLPLLALILSPCLYFGPTFGSGALFDAVTCRLRAQCGMSTFSCSRVGWPLQIQCCGS